MNQELIGYEQGLIGYWNFNEVQDSIAIDITVMVIMVLYMELKLVRCCPIDTLQLLRGVMILMQ